MGNINKKWEFIALLLIIIVAAVFRFHQLDNRGYIFPDERCYNFAGRNLLNTMSKVDTIMNISSQEREAKLENAVSIIGITNQFFAKPMHTLLTAAGLAIFSFKQYGDLYFFALLGTLSVILIYVIARTFWDSKVALLSSLYMALSPFHISYSRAALAQAGSLFFLILSLYFYLQSLKNNKNREIKLCASGLLLGVGITSHHVVAIYLIIYIVFELGLLLKKRSTFKQLVILSCAAFIPLFFFEFLYIIGKIYTGDKVLSYTNSYFLASILQFLSATPHGGFHLSDPSSGWLFPIKFWLSSEGCLSLVFIVIAIIHLCSKINKQKARISSFLLLAICFPYVFWAIISSHGLVARVYSPLIPVLSIAVGIGITRFHTALSKTKIKELLRKVLIVGLSCTLFIGIFVNAKRCISYNSPYESLKKYMYAHGIDVVGTIGGWFFFEDIENIRAKTWSGALELYEQGKVRFFINDSMAMDPQALKEFLQIRQGVVAEATNAFNYIPYQYEGVPVEIRQIWSEHMPLQVKLIDLKKYIQKRKK